MLLKNIIRLAFIYSKMNNWKRVLDYSEKAAHIYKLIKSTSKLMNTFKKSIFFLNKISNHIFLFNLIFIKVLE